MQSLHHGSIGYQPEQSPHHGSVGYQPVQSLHQEGYLLASELRTQARTGKNNLEWQMND
jgi:hypothetical protein